MSVIRTCVTAERMSLDKVVLTYKSLAKVERAFRSLKSIDLHIRPIRHWNDDRIAHHVFRVCWRITSNGKCVMRS